MRGFLAEDSTPVCGFCESPSHVATHLPALAHHPVPLPAACSQQPRPAPTSAGAVISIRAIRTLPKLAFFF